MGKLNINGIETTDENAIRNGITDFYTELFNNQNDIEINRDFFKEMFTVQYQHQDGIHTPIALDKMWSTKKSVRAQTPELDSISNLYIPKLWDILGPIILEA